MRQYIAIASALLLTVAASAQNLNPTVQVTNAYDNRLMDISKNVLEMNVPDSLLKFDWNFNYSVFDNPYKGAYEFNPYIIEMKPGLNQYDGSRFYFRAGAGYTLHPEAQLVWNPVLKKKLGLVLYDDYKGHFGKYAGVESVLKEAGNYVMNGGDPFVGHDMTNRFGVKLRYDAPSTIMGLDASTGYLYSNGEDIYKHGFEGHNSVDAKTSFTIRSNAPYSDFQYDAGINASYLNDRGIRDDSSVKNEYTAGGNFTGRYDVADRQAVKLALGFGVSGYSPSNSDNKLNSTSLDVTPSYIFSADRLSIEAGLKFSNVWKNMVNVSMNESRAMSTEEVQDPDYKGRKFYPSLHVSYEAVEDAMVMFADVTGGQKFNTYGSYLSGNHFFDPFGTSFASWYYTGLGDVTVTSFDASAGLSGRFGTKFQYKLDGGYARLFNSPLEGIDFIHPNNYYFTYDMANYDLLYADVEAAWSSEKLDFMTDMKVQKTNFRNFKYAASLPVFSGSAELRYNWQRRVFAGVSAEWATGRKCTGQEVMEELPPSLSEMPSDYVCRIPGWVDLGVNAEYRFNKYFSLWLKGGNLLNQSIRRNLLMAEKGPYFTLGICLNL